MQPRSAGTIDWLTFTPSEVDLNQESILIHLEVENVGREAKAETPRVSAHHPIQSRLAKRYPRQLHQHPRQEGALSEDKNSLTFPSVGKKGAFVLQFPRPETPQPTKAMFESIRFSD